MSGLPTIALTGATGFIGSYLLGELTRRGYPVRVLVRRPTTLPANCTNAVIGDLSRPINMAAALADVDTVIHSAGLAPGMSGAPEDDFRRLNAEATANLARAAQQARVRRFIFLSSVRAQADLSAANAPREDAPALPTDSYGRSKLAAENELAHLAIDWVALRLALVFGPGVKGNMAALIRLARSPFWLPFGALAAPRSLLSLDNLMAAVELSISLRPPLKRPLIVADPDPLTVPQILTALRAGLGRSPRLIAVPDAALRLAFRLARREELYRRLAEPLVADPAELLALGWAPRVRTPDALAALVQDASPVEHPPRR